MLRSPGTSDASTLTLVIGSKNEQIIATLDVPELSAQVAGSQAEVRHSQSEIARAQSGVALAEANYEAIHAAYTRLSEASKRRPGLVAEQELDDSRARDLDAQAKINVAKSALDATKQQLGVSQADNQRVQSLKDYSIVTAPFAGVVTMRYADVGSLIQAGTASNTQSMVSVSQNHIASYQLLAAHAVGGSSGSRWMDELASPGRIAARYSRTGILSRRQVSTMETIAATRGPAFS